MILPSLEKRVIRSKENQDETWKQGKGEETEAY